MHGGGQGYRFMPFLFLSHPCWHLPVGLKARSPEAGSALPPTNHSGEQAPRATLTPPLISSFFLLHSISPFQAPGDQPVPPPPQLAALGFICRNLTTGSFPRPNEASPSGGKGVGFGRNLGWVEGMAGFLWLSKASPPLVGSTAPSSCLLIWLWEVWRTNFMVSSAG